MLNGIQVKNRCLFREVMMAKFTSGTTRKMARNSQGKTMKMDLLNLCFLTTGIAQISKTSAGAPEWTKTCSQSLLVSKWRELFRFGNQRKTFLTTEWTKSEMWTKLMMKI